MLEQKRDKLYLKYVKIIWWFLLAKEVGSVCAKNMDWVLVSEIFVAQPVFANEFFEQKFKWNSRRLPKLGFMLSRTLHTLKSGSFRNYMWMSSSIIKYYSK